MVGDGSERFVSVQPGFMVVAQVGKPSVCFGRRIAEDKDVVMRDGAEEQRVLNLYPIPAPPLTSTQCAGQDWSLWEQGQGICTKNLGTGGSAVNEINGIVPCQFI